MQADPLRGPGGGRCTRAAPGAVEEAVHRTYWVTRHPGVDGARHLGGPDRQRLALPVFVLHTGETLLALSMVA